MADFNTLSQQIKDRLWRDARCDSGDVQDGATATAAEVRECPLMARLRYKVDLSKGGGLCDPERDQLDTETILGAAASQADADAGAALLISMHGAADYDDAARRALALMAYAHWSV